MHRSILTAALVLLAALLVPTPALAAGAVYLNGVRIDGITSALANQKFEKATVRIDEKGDVHIDVVGFKVQVITQPAPSAPAAAVVTPPPVAPAPAPAPPAAPVAAPVATPPPAPAAEEPATLTRRYWLVTEQATTGMAEYDIDLYINSKWIRKLRSNETQVVTEVTRHLLPGKNTVLMTARKVVSGTRKSYSPQHYFKVIIGEGNVGGDNVMIDNPIIRFQRTAADTEDVSEEFTLKTR